LRAAVVGAGVFGRHHATKYLRQPGVTLTPLPIRALKPAAKLPRSWAVPPSPIGAKLLGRVDLVSICSPAGTHAEIVARS